MFTLTISTDHLDVDQDAGQQLASLLRTVATDVEQRVHIAPVDASWVAETYRVQQGVTYMLTGGE